MSATNAATTHTLNNRRITEPPEQEIRLRIPQRDGCESNDRNGVTLLVTPRQPHCSAPGTFLHHLEAVCNQDRWRRTKKRPTRQRGRDIPRWRVGLGSSHHEPRRRWA